MKRKISTSWRPAVRGKRHFRQPDCCSHCVTERNNLILRKGIVKLEVLWFKKKNTNLFFFLNWSSRVHRKQLFLWWEVGTIKWNKSDMEWQILHWCHQGKEQARYMDKGGYERKMLGEKMVHGNSWIQESASYLSYNSREIIANID